MRYVASRHWAYNSLTSEVTIKMISKSTSFLIVTTICYVAIAVLNSNTSGTMYTLRGNYEPIPKSFRQNATWTTVYPNQSSVIPTYQSVKDAGQIQNTSMMVIATQEIVETIDVTRTIVSLKSPNRTVKVGDFFSVIIEARGSHGGHRTKGGDFFFANIRSKKGNAAGKITDFNNGTYEAIFFVAWSGVISIEIILVHPSNTVDYIVRELWPMEDRIVWNGTFQSNQTIEKKVCRFTKDKHLSDKCKYSHPLAIGKTAFYCDKPLRLSCKTLKVLQSDGRYVDAKFSKLYNSHVSFFNNSVTYKRLTNGTTSVNITSTDNRSTLIESIWLPECKADLPIPLSEGFWTGKIWTSLKCNTKQWTKPEIIQCIKGKHIIFMGDSTTRQWTEGMLNIMEVSKSNYTTRPTPKRIWHYSEIMTLDFYFHPYTIGSAPSHYRTGKWEYEILDNLNFSLCNYVIVVSPWAHYTQWTKESFLERLHLLRETILRFMKRCPKSLVLMKTPHPREHNNKAQLFYTNDKLLYDIYELYYTLFSGLGIHIIDVWDMNLAYPKANTVHMPMAVIYQELFMMVSHICPVN